MTTTASPITYNQDTAHEGACIMCMGFKPVCDVRVNLTGKITTICASCSLVLLNLLTP